LYGCETWSVTLREQYRLRVFDYRVLRDMFGSKTEDTMGDRRKIHNEELDDLHCSAGIIRVIGSRKMRWAGHVACVG
jgi:hypothetical protein